jgi:RES domain-containing protein
MVGYRLVRKARASDAFNGEGARRFGGRWNPKNIPVVYGSESLSLALLEFRVNQGGYDPDDQYVYIPFEFDEGLVERVETPPADWLTRFKEDGSITAAQAFGEEWFLRRRSAVLSVPSAVVQIERNFVLNPQHADFAKVVRGVATKLNLDLRLWHR